MRELYKRTFRVPAGYEVTLNECYDGSSLFHYYIRKIIMAKSDKKKKVKEPVLSKKELKAAAEAEIAEEQAKAKKGKKGGQKSGKPEEKETTKAVKKALKKDEWDEQEGSGIDFVTFKSGEYLARVRSVVSLGQVVFSFNKNGKLVPDTRATSAMGFVLEVWKYKIDNKKGKIIIKSKEPAIVFHVMKAHKDNDKSHYTKMMKAFKAKSPAQLDGVACGVELYTSDKGYMYVRGGMKKLGFAETKAVPKLTKPGHLIPNLDAMTKEALLDLNPITQVKDYVLKAVNYAGSAAEKAVRKIRKSKPEFAMLKEKKEEGKGSGKKGKGKKPKKLSEKGEY